MPRKDPAAYYAANRAEAKAYAEAHREEINASARARRKAKRAALEASPDFPARQAAIRAKRVAALMMAARPKATHCLRGHERTPDNLQPNGTCKLCAKERSQTPEVKAKAAAWRAAHPLVPKPKKPTVTKTCALCSTEFTTNQPKSLYCSKKCKTKASKKRWRKKYPEKVKEQARKWCKNNPEKVKAGRKTLKAKARHQEKKNSKYKRVRQEVLTHYCKGTPQCQWPGCTVTEQLNTHHTGLEGEAWRKENGVTRGGYKQALVLKRQGYPEGIQVLCPYHHGVTHREINAVALINPSVPRPIISAALVWYRENQRERTQILYKKSPIPVRNGTQTTMGSLNA